MVFRISLVLLVFFMALGSSFVAYANDIEVLKPKEIVEYIEDTKGQKRIIMIYASWCHYCIKKMPSIMEVERIKKGSVIAISVDGNYKKFARYINKFDEVPFRIILNKASEYKLAKSFKKFGVEEWKGVPEIILLDENNKVIGQGNYKIDYVNEFLFNNQK